jgi:hypothetical protein
MHWISKSIHLLSRFRRQVRIFLAVLGPAELHEIFTAGDAKTLQDFCQAGHSTGVAELISALSGDDARALIGHVEISSLMPSALPKNTVHSHHRGLSRWHNPAARRITP